MSAGTFPVKLTCACGHRITPYFVAMEMVRFLDRHGASEDLLMGTVKCRSCDRVIEVRYSTLRWRPAA